MSAIDQKPGKTPPPVVTYIQTLSQAQYRELEKKCILGSVREDTTPVQSGFFNGVEHVLRKLREGFVQA